MIKRGMIIAAACSVGCALAAPVSAANVDLVTNGTFSAGNTGFASTFHYEVQTAPGAYYIQTGADHTTGTGQFMTPDAGGSGDPVADNQYFWQESFAVAQNSDYTFSAYVRLANYSPTLVAVANGTQLVNAPLTGGGWYQLSGSYNSGSNSSVTLSLFNANPSYYYNDFDIDDISFVGPAASGASPAPEPATWAMMLGGFGFVGGAMRRRLRPAAALL